MGKKKQIIFLKLEVERLTNKIIDNEKSIDKLLSDTITESEKNVIKLDRQFSKSVDIDMDKYTMLGKKETDKLFTNNVLTEKDLINKEIKTEHGNTFKIVNFNHGKAYILYGVEKVHTDYKVSDINTFLNNGSWILMDGRKETNYVYEGKKIPEIINVGTFAPKQAKENVDKLINNLNLYDNKVPDPNVKPIQYPHRPVTSIERLDKPINSDKGVEAPNCDFQGLFDHMHKEHGLILTLSEMHEIIRESQKVVDLINNKEEHQPFFSYGFSSKSGVPEIKYGNNNPDGMVTIQVPVGSFIVPPTDNLIINKNIEQIESIFKDEKYIENIKKVDRFVGTRDTFLSKNKDHVFTRKSDGTWECITGMKFSYPLTDQNMLSDWKNGFLRAEIDAADYGYVEFKLDHGDKFVKEVEYEHKGTNSTIKTKITYIDDESAPKTMSEIHNDVNLMDKFIKNTKCNLSDHTKKDVNVWGHNVGDVSFKNSEMLDGGINSKGSFIVLEDIGNITKETIFRVRRLSNKDMNDSITNHIAPKTMSYHEASKKDERINNSQIIKDFLSTLKKDTDYLRSWKDNIAMAFQDNYRWAVESGNVDIHKISNDAATSFLSSLLQKPCDIIDVAQRLYYHMNPDSKMDVPSSAFELTEKWHSEWEKSDSDPEQSFFDWCIENKTKYKIELIKDKLRKCVSVITSVELDGDPIGTVFKNSKDCFYYNTDKKFRSIPFYDMYLLFIDGKVRIMEYYDQECAPPIEETREQQYEKTIDSIKNIHSFITLRDIENKYVGGTEGFTIPKDTIFIKEGGYYKTKNGNVLIPEESMLYCWINNDVSVWVLSGQECSTPIDVESKTS